MWDSRLSILALKRYNNTMEADLLFWVSYELESLQEDFTTVIINVYGNAPVWLNLAWKHFGRAFSHWLKFSWLKIPLDLGVKGYLQHLDLTSRFVSLLCSALCCSLPFRITSASPLQTCRTSNRMAVSAQSTGKCRVTDFSSISGECVSTSLVSQHLIRWLC